MTSFKEHIHQKLQLIQEKNYTYNVPQDKELLMYDFYLMTYVDSMIKEGKAEPGDKIDQFGRTIPSATTSMGIKDSTMTSFEHIKTQILDVLKPELLEATFYSMACEFRHVWDSNTEKDIKRVFPNEQDQKVFEYWNYYYRTLESQENISDSEAKKTAAERKKQYKTESGEESPSSTNYFHSYVAAKKVLKKFNITAYDFIEIAAKAFNKYHGRNSDHKAEDDEHYNLAVEKWEAYMARYNTAKKQWEEGKRNHHLTHKKEMWLFKNYGIKPGPKNDLSQFPEPDPKPEKPKNDGLRWNGSYGGRPWHNIAIAYLKLYNAQKEFEKILWIDNLYHQQHNTGTVFNKLQKYYKSGSGHGWILNALNFKADAKDNWERVKKTMSLTGNKRRAFDHMIIEILKASGDKTWEQYMSPNKTITKPKETLETFRNWVALKNRKPIISNSKGTFIYVGKGLVLPNLADKLNIKPKELYSLSGNDLYKGQKGDNPNEDYYIKKQKWDELFGEQEKAQEQEKPKEKNESSTSDKILFSYRDWLALKKEGKTKYKKEWENKGLILIGKGLPNYHFTHEGKELTGLCALFVAQGKKVTPKDIYIIVYTDGGFLGDSPTTDYFLKNEKWNEIFGELEKTQDDSNYTAKQELFALRNWVALKDEGKTKYTKATAENYVYVGNGISTDGGLFEYFKKVIPSLPEKTLVAAPKRGDHVPTRPNVMYAGSFLDSAYFIKKDVWDKLFGELEEKKSETPAPKNGVSETNHLGQKWIDLAKEKQSPVDPDKWVYVGKGGASISKSLTEQLKITRTIHSLLPTNKLSESSKWGSLPTVDYFMKKDAWESIFGPLKSTSENKNNQSHTKEYFIRQAQKGIIEHNHLFKQGFISIGEGTDSHHYGLLGKLERLFPDAKIAKADIHMSYHSTPLKIDSGGNSGVNSGTLYFIKKELWEKLFGITLTDTKQTNKKEDKDDTYTIQYFIEKAKEGISEFPHFTQQGYVYLGKGVGTVTDYDETHSLLYKLDKLSLNHLITISDIQAPEPNSTTEMGLAGNYGYYNDLDYFTKKETWEKAFGVKIDAIEDKKHTKEKTENYKGYIIAAKNNKWYILVQNPIAHSISILSDSLRRKLKDFDSVKAMQEYIDEFSPIHEYEDWDAFGKSPEIRAHFSHLKGQFVQAGTSTYYIKGFKPDEPRFFSVYRKGAGENFKPLTKSSIGYIINNILSGGLITDGKTIADLRYEVADAGLTLREFKDIAKNKTENNEYYRFYLAGSELSTIWLNGFPPSAKENPNKQTIWSYIGFAPSESNPSDKISFHKHDKYTLKHAVQDVMVKPFASKANNIHELNIPQSFMDEIFNDRLYLNASTAQNTFFHNNSEYALTEDYNIKSATFIPKYAYLEEILFGKLSPKHILPKTKQRILSNITKYNKDESSEKDKSTDKKYYVMENNLGAKWIIEYDIPNKKYQWIFDDSKLSYNQADMVVPAKDAELVFTNNNTVKILHKTDSFYELQIPSSFHKRLENKVVQSSAGYYFVDNDTKRTVYILSDIDKNIWDIVHESVLDTSDLIEGILHNHTKIKDVLTPNINTIKNNIEKWSAKSSQPNNEHILYSYVSGGGMHWLVKHNTRKNIYHWLSSSLAGSKNKTRDLTAEFAKNNNTIYETKSSLNDLAIPLEFYENLSKNLIKNTTNDKLYFVYSPFQIFELDETLEIKEKTDFNATDIFDMLLSDDYKTEYISAEAQGKIKKKIEELLNEKTPKYTRYYFTVNNAGYLKWITGILNYNVSNNNPSHRVNWFDIAIDNNKTIKLNENSSDNKRAFLDNILSNYQLISQGNEIQKLNIPSETIDLILNEKLFTYDSADGPIDNFCYHDSIFAIEKNNKVKEMESMDKFGLLRNVLFQISIEKEIDEDRKKQIITNIEKWERRKDTIKPKQNKTEISKYYAMESESGSIKWLWQIPPNTKPDDKVTISLLDISSYNSNIHPLQFLHSPLTNSISKIISDHILIDQNDSFRKLKIDPQFLTNLNNLLIKEKNNDRFTIYNKKYNRIYQLNSDYTVNAHWPLLTPKLLLQQLLNDEYEEIVYSNLDNPTIQKQILDNIDQYEANPKGNKENDKIKKYYVIETKISNAVYILQSPDNFHELQTNPDSQFPYTYIDKHLTIGTSDHSIKSFKSTLHDDWIVLSSADSLDALSIPDGFYSDIKNKLFEITPDSMNLPTKYKNGYMFYDSQTHYTYYLKPQHGITVIDRANIPLILFIKYILNNDIKRSVAYSNTNIVNAITDWNNKI